nr:hypothetical protein [Candidatus Anammoximicrobium sp.]
MPRLAVPRWVEEQLDEVLAGSLFGNSADRWVTAAAVLLLSLLTLRLLKRFLGRRLRTWGERQGADWVRESQAIVEDTRFWFCLIVSAYLGSLALTIPEKTGHLL